MLVDEVHLRIRELRRTLDVFDQRFGGSDDLSEGLRDLSLSVDHLRRSIWAVLTAGHEEDLPAYLARVRVERARQSCEDVLADLTVETLTGDTPGINAFHTALTGMLSTAPKL